MRPHGQASRSDTRIHPGGQQRLGGRPVFQAAHQQPLAMGMHRGDRPAQLRHDDTRRAARRRRHHHDGRAGEGQVAERQRHRIGLKAEAAAIRLEPDDAVEQARSRGAARDVGQHEGQRRAQPDIDLAAGRHVAVGARARGEHFEADIHQHRVPPGLGRQPPQLGGGQADQQPVEIEARHLRLRQGGQRGGDALFAGRRELQDAGDRRVGTARVDRLEGRTFAEGRLAEIGARGLLQRVGATGELVGQQPGQRVRRKLGVGDRHARGDRGDMARCPGLAAADQALADSRGRSWRRGTPPPARCPRRNTRRSCRRRCARRYRVRRSAGAARARRSPWRGPHISASPRRAPS